MAKINIARKAPPSYYKVIVEVHDPECKWNIVPFSRFFRILKAASIKGAEKAAKLYCSKWMKIFTKAKFNFLKSSIEPYYFHEHVFQKEED